MMKMLLIIAVVLLNFSQHIFAKNLFILAGGGGESIKNNSFNQDLVAAGQFLNSNPHWERLALFGGLQEDTIHLLDQYFYPNYSAFSVHDFKNVLSSINLNDFEKNSNIVFIISTHGDERRKNQKSHSLASGLFEENIDLDSLQNLTSQASQLYNSKRIKLAVIDSSCYSGAFQNLANENSCLISATSANNIGFIGQGADLVHNMQRGKNLEDTFLNFRLADNTMTLPAISTPAGIFIKNYISDPIESIFLLDYSIQNSKSSIEFNRTASRLLDELGDDFSAPHMTETIRLKNWLTRSDTTPFFTNPQVQSQWKIFYNVLNEYIQYRQELITNYSAEFQFFQNKKFQIECSISDSKTITQTFSLSDVFNIRQYIASGNPINSSGINNTSKSMNDCDDEIIEKVFHQKIDLLKDPFITAKLAKLDTLSGKIKQIQYLAAKVQHAERIFYNFIYNYLKFEYGSNICQEIVF